MTKKLKKWLKSFTLVELIIVIAIVAILSVAAFLVVTKWIGKSRDARRLSDVGTMVRSLTLYKSENGNVPMPSGSISTGTIETPDGEDDFSYVGTFGSETVGELDSLQVVPTDPMIEGQEYIYGVHEKMKEFEVGVTLELDEEKAYVNSVFALREKAKVDGNYKPRTVILTGNILKVIPSLLFVSEGGETKNIGELEAHFIVDGGNNKPYKIYGESLTGDDQHISLARAVGNKNASFEGVDLSNGTLTGIIQGVRDISLGETEMREILKIAIKYVNDEGISGGGLSGVDNISEIEADIESSLENYTFEQPDSNAGGSGGGGEEPPAPISTISETTCENVGWYWVSNTDDVYIGTSRGDGFCISPRVGDFGDSTGEGISWNGWGNDGAGDYGGWASNDIDDGGNSYSQYGQTRDIEKVENTTTEYSCTAIGSATIGFRNLSGIDNQSGEDTLENRMRYLATYKSDPIKLSEIDWISINSKPSYHNTYPALYIADCIDGVKDIGTDMTYTHNNDSTDEITYDEYSTDVSTSTESASLSNTTYQNRQKYLLAWTQKSGSHLPSAFSYISNDSPGGCESESCDNLLGNTRGEYQVACEYLKDINGNDFYHTTIGKSSDDNDDEWIWLSALGDVSGSSRGSDIRIVGNNGCSDQFKVYSGYRYGNISARFVVRP